MEHNPYIGPRPFERSDSAWFFGRTREARDLLSLIIAERVVLFYAQSGAGKTSLLNTQIVPALEEEGFQVLPIARVGSDIPVEVNHEDVPNIFVFSALLALAGPQCDASRLASQTLKDFLKPNLDSELTPVIIFDQFEEILTTHRDRWEDARHFFEQLRDALQAVPSLGLVLALREDHVAGLDPYTTLLPKRLKTRFRMELLGYDGALEAVKGPAQNAGCAFGTGVAERLVDDLRRIQVSPSSSRPSGGALGPYVEPVQLQVVCNRLWDNLPEREENIITWPEIEQFGDIDWALTDFYESALQHTTQATNVAERQLRRWFGLNLITPMKTRGLALRGDHETSGLPNEAVDALDQQHLIRAEVRAGAYWYELAHDRLVDPIMNSNAAWEQARMTPLRATAQNWQTSKNADLLYGGRALLEAQQWAQTHPVEVEDYERVFLEASAQVQKTKARNRVVRLSVITALSVGMIIMAALAVWAFQSKQDADQQRLVAYVAKATAEAGRREAERQSRIAAAAQAQAEASASEAELQSRLARAGQLAAQAQVLGAEFSARRLLLAVEALKTLQPSDPPLNSISDTLRQVLGDRAGAYLNVNNDLVTVAVFRPDSRELATGSDNGTVRLWDLNADPVNAQAMVLAGTPGESVSALAYSPDAKLLAAGDTRGQIRIWELPNAARLAVLTDTAPIRAIAISPDGRVLFSAKLDGKASEWQLSGTGISRVTEFDEHVDQITAVAVSRDGRYLATGSNDETVNLLDIATARLIASLLHDKRASVSAVSFSPNGRWLATGTAIGTVRVWDMAQIEEGKPVVLPGNGSTIDSVEFSQDLKWLSAQTAKGTTLIWNMRDLTAAPMEEDNQDRGLLFKLVSPDGRWLATDVLGKATLWPLSPDELVRRACTAAGRNLTRAEWSWYLGAQPYRKTCDHWPLEQ